jgi:ABC-type transporter lipoprotein component MlaA/predicted alpha/beta-fold hydrolase
MFKEDYKMKNIKRISIVILTIAFMLNASPTLSIEECQPKYPDYVEMYIGKDKFENFNRKMFYFNLRVNKYFLRPVHIVWATVMPKYCMDKISNITNNIEYPIRLISTLTQRDFQAVKTETIRFLTNTTLGIGGMFDVAQKILKIEPVEENMEQALAKCKMKSGSYLCLPFISSTTPRNVVGRLLDTAFNPTTYVGTPLIALVKLAITVNRTYYSQPIIKMVESNYADPYDISRKFYGLENYIKCANLDRINHISQWLKTSKLAKKEEEKVADKSDFNKLELLDVQNVLKGNADKTEIILNPLNKTKKLNLIPDIELSNFYPQSPTIDSLRTALFRTEGVDKSIWAEFSVWNRCFYNRLKTSSVNLFQGREDYKYKFLLQKTPKSPVVVIYPSIGEGIMSTHSASIAKLFYDSGYSVVILGSHFQWEFVKSMPENYFPGLPHKDVEYVKLLTDKILQSLQAKYKCEFVRKTTIGTSFGGLMTLFVGQKEFNPNSEDKNQYIAICPPIELIYAMKQIDDNTSDWQKYSNNLKNQTALTSAKLIQILQHKDEIQGDITSLPFSDEESKLIIGFVLHQKLSDIIFTIENTPKTKMSGIYSAINNMNYCDYVKKYLLSEKYKTIDELREITSLHYISSYLKNADNYKIYHSMDDYLTSTEQLIKLKQYSGTKTTLFNHGSHLGFLYRKEFLQQLQNNISEGL